MAGYLQESLEETQRRLALGSVTTAPMMQTLDNRRRQGDMPSRGRVLGIVAIVVGAVLLLMVALFAFGLVVDGDSGEIDAAPAASATP
jgi:hypothetical protein